MNRFTRLTTFLLLALFALPAAAQTPRPCTITTGGVWSGEGNYSFQGNTLTIGEGHYVSFNLIYKCTDLPQGARPVVSIVNPTLGTTGNFDNGQFGGYFSERDGFGDEDAVPNGCRGTTGATIADDGCRLEVNATSKDNNCRNSGGTEQRIRVTTQVTNAGPGTLNLSGEQTFYIVATDDDTIPQSTLDYYLGLGRMLNQKPSC